MDDPRAVALFFELFSGLPRQGPGDAACTRRALACIPRLDRAARILDVGCGTGAQTFELAASTPASILAVDLHKPFVDELNATSARLNLGDRVTAKVADMKALDLPPHHFNVLWSEGAIYNVGFDAGLRAWRPLLMVGGHVAVSELCWLRPEPPPECADYLAGEYPAIRDIAANREAVERAGYVRVADFCVPPSAWWRDYYDPLARNVTAFRTRHARDAVAQALAEQCDCEIEMFRRYSDCYGYVFFVMRKDGD